jgi:hypothetical protein
MKRRDVLVALGSATAGGLAGCVSTSKPNSESASTATQTPTQSSTASPTPPPTTRSRTTTRTGDRQRHVSLAAQDTIPDRHDVRIEATVVTPRATDEHPALLRITTTNEGPERAISVGTDGCHLFNRSDAGSDDPPGLWLHRPENAADIDRAGNRWVRDRPADEPRAYLAYACMPTTYAAGESVTTEYEVWDDYQVAGYLEPGTYRWEQDVQIWDTPERRMTDTPSGTVTWGFSLTVERPV